MIRHRRRRRRLPYGLDPATRTFSAGYSLGAVDDMHKPLISLGLAPRSKVSVFVELAKKTELIKRQSEHLARQNAEKLVQAKARAERESQFKSKFLGAHVPRAEDAPQLIYRFSELLEQEIFGPLTENSLHAQDRARERPSPPQPWSTFLDLSKVEWETSISRGNGRGTSNTVTSVHGAIKPLADKRSVAIELRLPSDLPHFHVDPRRCREVISNLLTNAIKLSTPTAAG